MKLNDLIYRFDERRSIALPGDHVQAIEFALLHFIDAAQTAIAEHGRFIVALSGGSTPKEIFQKLATPHYRESIDWSFVYLFWGDERAVGPDHPDSNYKMAMDAGFAKLSIPKNQIFRMHAESEIEKHALDYEKLIKKTLQGKSFDLIMLGMGEDGHTASLFPKTRALQVEDRLVVANEVPQKATWRMTFTYPLINEAHHIAIYVMGENKKERLKDVLTDTKGVYPSSKIGTSEHPALWIIDDPASEELCKVWHPHGK